MDLLAAVVNSLHAILSPIRRLPNRRSACKPQAAQISMTTPEAKAATPQAQPNVPSVATLQATQTAAAAADTTNKPAALPSRQDICSNVCVSSKTARIRQKQQVLSCTSWATSSPQLSMLYFTQVCMWQPFAHQDCSKVPMLSAGCSYVCTVARLAATAPPAWPAPCVLKFGMKLASLQSAPAKPQLQLQTCQVRPTLSREGPAPLATASLTSLQHEHLASPRGNLHSNLHNDVK